MSDELERRVPLVKSTSCIPGTPECVCADAQRAATMLALAAEVETWVITWPFDRDPAILADQWRLLVQEAGMMQDPEEWPPQIVWLINRNTNKVMGTVICQTEMDLTALCYALKNVENIGYEAHLFPGIIKP